MGGDPAEPQAQAGLRKVRRILRRRSAGRVEPGLALHSVSGAGSDAPEKGERGKDG